MVSLLDPTCFTPKLSQPYKYNLDFRSSRAEAQRNGIHSYTNVAYCDTGHF